MKNSIIALLLLLGLSVNAQNWESLIYEPDQPGLESNPLKGFVDLFVPDNDFPRSMNAKLFGLDDVMLGMDDFDWTLVDDFLDESELEGNHAYLQVNIDPGFGMSYMPDFLDGLVEFENYTQGPVPDLCPDWNNVFLMDAMINFIDSFGVRYNNDNRVFMVHLGLYGIFGEWHIGDVENVRPEFEMTPENKIRIADAYKNAFPDKFLLARYPENMPNPQDFGYSDGLFFTQSISENSFNHFYFHYTLRAYHSNFNWKIHPVGGEIDPCIQDTLWKSWPNITETLCGDPPNQVLTDIQDVQASFDSIHPTWLFSHHIFTAIEDDTSIEWANAITAQKKMGYTFYVNEYRLTSLSGNPTIEVNIQNKGIAPMYANWDIELGVINAADEFQSLGTTKWNLDIIQPDGLDNYRSFASTTTLVDGTYKFLMRIVNPLNVANAKQVTFANETQDVDSAGWLTLGEATITAGNVGTTPTMVSSISLSQSNATMIVGDNLQLSATVSPSGATNQTITWVSDQPGTAAINATGLVSAGPSYGDAKISAYTQDGNFVAMCDITVEPIRVNIPAVIQAEDYIRMSGIVVENLSGGNQNIGFVDDRDWMDYGVVVNAPTIFTVDYFYSSQNGGGEISLIDSSGSAIDFLELPKTLNGWPDYDTLSSNPVLLLPGAYNLRLGAKKGGFNLDWFEFRADIPLLASYTFLGTINDQYNEGSNWDGGFRPPNGYNGLITIQADCVLPAELPFLLNHSGQLIVSDNVELKVE